MKTNNDIIPPINRAYKKAFDIGLTILILDLLNLFYLIKNDV